MSDGAKPALARIRVGISGWRYPPWRGVFYPPDLPQSQELGYAASVLPVIEINGTFYSLQRPEHFAAWHDTTPADFLFTVKGPRFITHIKRLKDVATPLANFLASGLFELRGKLGPILWQFPPHFSFRPDRLRAFFKLLPRDTAAAARRARRHDARLRGRCRLTIDGNRPMRHAMEIRHPSFATPEFIALLREFQVGLVVAETARRWPMLQDITADFVYLRLHGDTQLYQSGYSDRALGEWARRIRAWHRGAEPRDARRVSPEPPPSRDPRDIYCFFDNTDVKLRAPFDAQSLMKKLGVKWPPDRRLSARAW